VTRACIIIRRRKHLYSSSSGFAETARSGHRATRQRIRLVATVVTNRTAPRLSFIGKLALASEIVAIYLQVRWEMRRRELGDVVPWLRRPRRDRFVGPLSGGPDDARRLGRAVELTLEALPMDARCLMRSLVLLRLLARRELRAELVIAVKEPTSAIPIDAHAWVEHDRQPLLWPGESSYQRLLTL
jgi:hypothetical protein